MLWLLWKTQLQIQYTPVKLRPHVCVPEEPGEFHSQKAAECHQERKPHQALGRGTGHIIDPFQGQNCMNKEKRKPIKTCGLILCDAHCMLLS